MAGICFRKIQLHAAESEYKHAYWSVSLLRDITLLTELLGELELTFMNQICRAANLRPLLRDDEVQKAIFEVINAFNEIFHEDGRGTRISDNLRLVEDAVSSRGQKQKKADQVVKLEDDVYAALLVSVNGATGRDLYVDHNAGRKMPEQEYLRSDATRLTRIFKGGVTYKACSDSRKDSHVLLDIHPEAGQPLGPSQWPPASLVAADILHIFSHKRFYGGGWIEETFLAINRLMPLSDYDTGRDIYRKYETAGGFLCYDRYCETIEIVRPDTIISHFAKTTMDIQQIEPRCVHVLPLDRVSFPCVVGLYIDLIINADDATDFASDLRRLGRRCTVKHRTA